MKKILMAAVAAMTLGFAGGNIEVPSEPEVLVTPAAKNFYVGGAITGVQTFVDGESSWFSDDEYAETGYGLQAQAGYVFYRKDALSVAGEVSYGRTFWAYDIEDDSYLETAGIFVKPAYNFGGQSVYAKLGYGYAKYDDNYESIDADGFAWGVGYAYEFTTEIEAFVDYTVYPSFDDEFDDIENNVIAIGVNYKF
jgi:hypothetical protein